MAFHPRMTRPGLRVTLAALEAYLSLLLDEQERKHADNVIRELRYQWESAAKRSRTANTQPSISQGERNDEPISH